MFPVLFALGPLKLFTLNIFLVLAFLSSAFVFWKKGREEHYSEVELFDGFLVSMVMGYVVGRLGFVLLHWAQFEFNIFKWFDTFAYPGVNMIFAIAGATAYLYWLAKNKKWDTFEIMDFWVLSLNAGLTWLFVGFFFEGSYIGTDTNVPWGVVFPGLLQKHHPVQLYYAAFFLVMYFYLSRVEYRYRTFSWYRGGKHTAQTGFLISSFLIFSQLFIFLISFMALPGLMLYGIQVDRWGALLGFAAGVILLYYRSGRSLLFWRHRRVNTIKTFKV